MFTRFNGNVEPFAKDATGTERTVFGDTAQSDDINDNLNTDFLRGWGIVGINDNPTKQDFNALAYTISNLVAYLYQQGVAEWNTDQEYLTNSYCVGSDGKLYRAKTGTTGSPNQGNDPTTDSTNWGQYNALDVLYSGTLSSTNVKSALDELDSSKMEGASSSTDNAIAIFNGTSGNLLQNSKVQVDDSGNISLIPTVNNTDLTLQFKPKSSTGSICNVLLNANSEENGVASEFTITTRDVSGDNNENFKIDSRGWIYGKNMCTAYGTVEKVGGVFVLTESFNASSVSVSGSDFTIYFEDNMVRNTYSVVVTAKEDADTSTGVYDDTAQVNYCYTDRFEVMTVQDLATDVQQAFSFVIFGGI